MITNLETIINGLNWIKEKDDIDFKGYTARFDGNRITIESDSFIERNLNWFIMKEEEKQNGDK